MERRAAIPGQTHLPPSLLRLSVGIEDVEDLWADLGACQQGFPSSGRPLRPLTPLFSGLLYSSLCGEDPHPPRPGLCHAR